MGAAVVARLPLALAAGAEAGWLTADFVLVAALVLVALVALVVVEERERADEDGLGRPPGRAALGGVPRATFDPAAWRLVRLFFAMPAPVAVPVLVLVW
jgi:hypothetical protein